MCKTYFAAVSLRPRCHGRFPKLCQALLNLIESFRLPNIIKFHTTHEDLHLHNSVVMVITLYNIFVIFIIFQRQAGDAASTQEYEYDSDYAERTGRADDDYAYDADADYPAQDESEAALGLPADSRSIRDNLVDVFSCEGRPYGKLGDYIFLYILIYTHIYIYIASTI